MKISKWYFTISIFYALIEMRSNTFRDFKISTAMLLIVLSTNYFTQQLQSLFLGRVCLDTGKRCCTINLEFPMKKGGIFISIYQKVKEEHHRLTLQLEDIRSRLSSLPDGGLICARNGRHFKWYLTDGHHKTYIPKKNREYVEQLAVKKYLSLQAQSILREIRSMEYYLRHHESVRSPAEDLLTAPEYQELLASHFTPVSQELFTWMSAPYERNQQFPEQLIHKTSSGIMVRSKSEAIIDMLLHINKIPFRYECKLQLGETILYPDFTLRHPSTGQIFYWEHFGMMDNSSYCRNASAKLQLYFSHGIIPTINLITTYETRDNPLDLEIIEEIIRHHFL